MTKVIIFDASTIISFVMNGLLPEFRELKRKFKGRFVITEEVKGEVIDKPINIKRFELEALKVTELLRDKTLEMASALRVNDDEIREITDDLLETANKTFYSGGKGIHIIHLGEASCLALSRILSRQKMSNIFAVDERTTRLLIEKPENLKRVLERKLHKKISVKKENFLKFKGFKVIRSPELVYVAWKKNLTRLKGEKVLDAMLYAVKFKGAAVSNDEIDEIKRIAKH